MILQLSSATSPSSCCVQLLLKDSPLALSQTATPAQLEESHPGFDVDTSDFSVILSEPRTKYPKTAAESSKGKGKKQ